MYKKALPITTGAMMIAIFGVMLLLNRQTGDIFQGVFVFILPIPMVAYAVQYGWKRSLPVWAAMCLTSFFFGTFATVFYASVQSFTGLVFGTMLYNKKDTTQTLFTVMLLSVSANILNLLFSAALFGYNLTADANELMTIMKESMEKAGQALPDIMLSTAMWKQMLIVSMVFSGVIQGFIMFQLTLIILRRLKFPVERAKSIYLYFPPRWLGFVCLGIFFVYNASLSTQFADERAQNAIQIVGLCCYMYLMAFGMIGTSLTVLVHFPRIKFGGVIASVLALFIMPYFLVFMGVFYSSTSYHNQLLERAAQQSKNTPTG